MTKYLVKLYPYDKFFFGGEQTFGEDNSSSYLVKSNYFPQQTALLGFVRHQLLLQCKDETIFKDNKIQNKEVATKLIGKSSFDVAENFPYGKINSLSPIFISDNNNIHLFPSNKEYQNSESAMHEIHLDPFVELEGYDPKHGLADLFIDKDLHRYSYEGANGIFREVKQVGIRKNYKGKTEDNAYYIQSFYQLTESRAFAFILELADDAIFESKILVSFGGEQQSFRMEVISDWNVSIEAILPNFQPSIHSDKLVLISDAYMEADVLPMCSFAITDTVDFRFLKTTVQETENYYGLSRDQLKTNKVTKSEKFNLYKKGSVFYGEAENIKAIKEILEKNTVINNLGYNHCKIINKSHTI